MVLDDQTAVVAVRRLVQLQPPRLGAGVERAPVRSAEEVVAAAAGGGSSTEQTPPTTAAAAAAAGTAGTAELGSVSNSYPTAPTLADDAAVARGFSNAAHERAAFDLMVAALCTVISRRLGGFRVKGLMGFGRRLGQLGVRHDGFWQVGCEAMGGCSACCSGVLGEVWSRGVWSGGNVEVEDSLHCVYAIIQHHDHPSTPKTQAWCHRTSNLMKTQGLPLAILAPSLQSMLALQCTPPTPWVQQLHSYSLPRLRQLRVPQLGRLVVLVGGLAPAPADEWWVGVEEAVQQREEAVVDAGRSMAAATAKIEAEAEEGEAAGKGAAADAPAVGVARVLRGACLAAGQQQTPPGAGQQAVLGWCRTTLLSIAAGGQLTPAAAVLVVAALSATRAVQPDSGQQAGAAAVALFKQQESDWVALWMHCLEQLRADEWQLPEPLLGQLCDALAQQQDNSSPQVWQQFPEGWMDAFEQTTLQQLPSFPPWLLLALLHAFALRQHAPSARWLGACLLLLQPFAGRLSARQLMQIAGDLACIAEGGEAASGGSSGVVAPSLPASCLEALSAAAAACAVEGELGEQAAGVFQELQRRRR